MLRTVLLDMIPRSAGLGFFARSVAVIANASALAVITYTILFGPQHHAIWRALVNQRDTSEVITRRKQVVAPAGDRGDTEDEVLGIHGRERAVVVLDEVPSGLTNPSVSFPERFVTNQRYIVTLFQNAALDRKSVV